MKSAAEIKMIYQPRDGISSQDQLAMLVDEFKAQVARQERAFNATSVPMSDGGNRLENRDAVDLARATLGQQLRKVIQLTNKLRHDMLEQKVTV